MDGQVAVAVTPVRRQWSTALVLAGAMFLVLFDSLAVATALPAIGDEFGLAPGRLQWVVTLYSLSIGGFLVLGGRVCDVWGRRRTMVASLGLTAGGLLMSGVAPGVGLLLAGRVMQGVGAAFAIPAALASAGTLFPVEPWRSRVFSVVASAANTAGIAGAVGGGLITSLLGWRWLFLIVVPVAATAAVVALRVLPPDPPMGARRRMDGGEADGPARSDGGEVEVPAWLDGGEVEGSARSGGGRLEVRSSSDGAIGARGRPDVGGAVLVTGGLVAIIHGAGQAGDRGLAAGAVLPMIAGLVMLAVLGWWERRAADPLIKPSVVRSRRLSACSLAFAAHSAAYSAVVVVGSLVLQERHGLSAAQAGLALAPMLVGALISAVPAGALLRRYGTRTVAATALLLCSAALAAAASCADGPVPAIVACLAVWGLCGGPIYVALTRAAVVDAAPADRGVASALFESASHVGGAVAVAVFLSMIGAGAGYGGAQYLGAATGAVAVAVLLAVMPRSDPNCPASGPEAGAAAADPETARTGDEG
ncbi:MFS family permease [Actinoplanes campanulatus]|uniref:MFS family permease n=1 Tax=Actinoplanes campanulatus TaxID=113559 RepID=A0A7W5AI40_9ACTN|nr:MFS transporter [Actinoplanes campanulatus]MBB3096707.1 MFS family permease [Actinoplanes campanulatus]GGN30762.1 MFS transporter [Actinoplanes campanulatus]GID37250.1 MFS transporter [Actinoplanes campanulatus]